MASFVLGADMQHLQVENMLQKLGEVGVSENIGYLILAPYNKDPTI